LSNASQEIVYNYGAKDILISALEGYNGCILCYGQTGAGKTFTMTGAQTDYKYRGIAPRLLSSLYQEINSRYEHQIKVSISYIELYNETLVDLLDAESTAQLSIQEDQKGYVLVKGQTLRQADNEEDALQVLFEGENNKTVASHKLNNASSRAHSVFTIHLEIRSKVESSEKVVMSKINLVDLAGSERTKKTGSEGITLIEAQFINKSLSFLEQVVVALSDQQRDHIPYRQNKLTYLLKDSIGGNSKTCMIANIWPEAAHLE
jgi:kinesin family protein 6/9